MTTARESLTADASSLLRECRCGHALLDHTHANGNEGCGQCACGGFREEPPGSLTASRLGAWCETCQDECLPVNGRCLWCDAIVVKAFSQDPIGDCLASPGLHVRFGAFRSKAAAALECGRVEAAYGVQAYVDGATVYVVTREPVAA